MKGHLTVLTLVLLAACAHHRPKTTVAPLGLATSPEVIDSLWQTALLDFRAGRWNRARIAFERLAPSFQPGDPRGPKAHFYLAECLFARHDHLQATREFRKVADDTPNDPLAPEALLRAGDAYADLWRRPELDPTYGQTAVATYQELINRYPGGTAALRARQRVDDLEDRFAFKSYRAALFYFRLKAYDSAILYLKSLLTTYPKAKVAPEALIKLIEAYRILGYKEDIQETCGYLRQFHPGTPGTDRVCPQPPQAAP